MNTAGYAFARIVEQEDVDETWVPRIVDKQGTVHWQEDDGRLEQFTATGLMIYRDEIDLSARLLAVEKVEIFGYVSRTRLVAVCPGYDKARVRDDRTFLVGQLRWPWLSDVGYSEKAGRLSTNQLRLVAMDGETGQWLYVDFELGTSENARRVAEQVLTAASAARRTYSYVEHEQRAQLETLRLPPFDPASKRFATVRIPAARKVDSSTAYPDRPPVQPAPPTPAEPLAAPTSTEALAMPAPVDSTGCPRCGAKLPEQARFCRACGHRLIADPPPVPAPEDPPPVPLEARCASCSAVLPKDARFCRACGTRVDGAPSPTPNAPHDELPVIGADLVDLSRYHDLTQRLAAYSIDGGEFLRGDREDVQVEDAEPVLADGEREVARVVGAFKLVGSRTTKSDSEPSVGLVMDGLATLVITSHRILAMAIKGGATQLGPLDGSEVHTFALPWDLVDLISMPARKSFTDRIAGARTITIFSSLVFVHLSLTPSKHAEIDGRAQPVTDDAVMDLLTRAAANHRLTVSPAEDHPRLRRLLEGHYNIEDNEKHAEITADQRETDLPSHLIGRVVEGNS